MKTTFIFISQNLIILFIGLCSFSSCTNESKNTTDENVDTYTENAVELGTDAPCLCDSSWFPHSQTPAPAEGEGSPFDVSSTTNCIFHQWSWQKFLWLTEPDGDQPLFLNQAKIMQISDAMAPVAQQAGASVVLTYTEQAGPRNGVLQTNPHYNSVSNQAYTVHYSIHTNTIMMNAAHAFKEQIARNVPVQYESFPVSSLELKISWVNAAAIPSDKIGNYFTTTAALSSDNGSTFTNTTVALLGMHVVGVVQNHPEFIWATFEHNDIAPNYNWAANSANSASEKLLFSQGSTTGLGGITFDTTKHVDKAEIPNKAYDLFQFGVPENSAGYMVTSQSEPANFNHIKEINACVAENLKDVWNNYFYNGSIWINTDGLNTRQQAELIDSLGYSIGAAKPGSSARGSLNNANVSMETFTQTFKTDISEIAVNNLTNCLSCHSGISFTGKKSPIYMSHVFDAFIESSNGNTLEQINTMKDKQQILQLVDKIE